MKNELLIKIVSDSKGEKVSFENIPINIVDYLKSLLHSMTELVSLYGSHEEFCISLREGSIVSALAYNPEVSSFDEDFFKIIRGQSSDSRKIQVMRRIQKTIKNAPMEIEVTLSKNAADENITHYFKGNTFKSKKIVKESHYNRIFLNGQLFEVGGKGNTFISIDSNSENYKIQCKKEEALNLNTFLYHNVYLSILGEKSNLSKSSNYKLNNVYETIEEMKEFQDFYSKIMENKSLERYDLIYNIIVNMVEKSETNRIVKFIKLFDEDFIDRGAKRTILMTLKPVINKDFMSDIKPYFLKLAKSFGK